MVYAWLLRAFPFSCDLPLVLAIFLYASDCANFASLEWKRPRYAIFIEIGSKNMAEDFSKNLLKEYTHWAVYVHDNQSYLGRCIVWCKREDALDLADATREEQTELFSVLRNVREALKKIFQPDWFNYSFLGNDTRHLHAHLIPRYAKPKTFMDTVFEDKSYGHNYKTVHSFVTPEEILKAVRNQLVEALK